MGSACVKSKEAADNGHQHKLKQCGDQQCCPGKAISLAPCPEFATVLISRARRSNVELVRVAQPSASLSNF